jgi:hypothetical protein
MEERGASHVGLSMSLKEEVVQLKEVVLHMPSAVDNCTNT